METDATTITDFSNRLDSAQAKITAHEGTILTLSNRLNESASTSLTLSNQITLQSERITRLSQRVTTAASENETLGRNATELSNQVSALKEQIARTETSLAETNQTLAEVSNQNVLLQHAFLRDAAERLVLERKFNSLTEVQAQEQKILSSPARIPTLQSIYAGLNVEVTTNGIARIIAPE